MLDKRLAAAEGGSPQALAALDSGLAEVEDMLSYCSDAMGLGEQARTGFGSLQRALHPEHSSSDACLSAQPASGPAGTRLQVMAPSAWPR